jgi:hypothetical protein
VPLFVLSKIISDKELSYDFLLKWKPERFPFFYMAAIAALLTLNKKEKVR